MENELYAYFDINPDIAYPIILGNVYRDQFNEEINSMSILLDNVSPKIEFNRPYHFVKIVNKGDGIKWNNNNYIFMLVDNYVETETNIFEHIYSYQINLMNTIKLLEKIQCSNLCITHSLVSGSKTIYDYIDQYMKFYCPRVKMNIINDRWNYEYLINWTELDIEPFNNTICADMQLNECTLRDLLTSLMLQVACIPTMNYLNLSFINFKDNPTPFLLDNTITGIRKSNSSDSYVNSLIISPTQVLDSENEVITENIGFRDSQNVLLKQNENLKLETRFPIYNIKNVKLKYGFSALKIKPQNQSCLWNINTWPVIYNNIEVSGSGHRGNGQFCFTHIDNSTSSPIAFEIHFGFMGHFGHKGIIKNLKIHLCKSQNNKVEEIYEPLIFNQQWFIDLDDISDNKNIEIPTSKTSQSALPRAHRMKLDGSVTEWSDWSIYVPRPQAPNSRYVNTKAYFIRELITDLGRDDIIPQNIDFAWVEWDFVDAYENNRIIHQLVPLCGAGAGSYYRGFYSPITFNSNNLIVGIRNYFGTSYYNDYQPFDETSSGGYYDLTPNFVEASKRQLLETDFTTMPSSGTFEDLAKWRYGTVQYNIGSNVIEGFSQTYSKAVGWWQETKNYFDNILTFGSNNDLLKNDVIIYASPEKIQEYSEKYGNIPINENTLGPNKEIIIDNNKGRYLFTITYQPLNNFKMKLNKENIDIDFPIEQFNGSDSGLSDYNRLVLKNQDMANRMGNDIITITQKVTNINDLKPLNSILNNKYIIFKRDIAINLDSLDVTYTASEKYVMQNYFTSIITKYRAYEYVGYNSSVVRKENKKIYCLISENYIDGDDYIQCDDYSIFLSGIQSYEDNKSCKYVIKKSLNENNEEESIKEEISLLTYDNGFCILNQDYDNISAGSYLLNPDVDSGLGGTVQKWQIWNQDEYNNSHEINYVYNIECSQTDIQLQSMVKFPILDNTMIYEDSVLFKLVDNKDSNKYSYYKDNAEIINQTLQFEYYTDSPDISWTKNFILHNKIVGRLKDNPNILLDQNKNIINIDLNSAYTISSRAITINWRNITSEVTEITIANDSGIEYMTFKRTPNDVTYFISLNDTKTLYSLRPISAIGRPDNSGLFRRIKCKNGEERLVDLI